MLRKILLKNSCFRGTPLTIAHEVEDPSLVKGKVGVDV